MSQREGTGFGEGKKHGRRAGGSKSGDTLGRNAAQQAPDGSVEFSEESIQRVLVDRFGIEDFRPGQREVMTALMQGRNAAAVFPTGGGKSLCYQLPALLLPGTTLVVSPLIALMKDQCDALGRLGIEAVRLDSTLESAELSSAMTNVRSGKTKLVYVAPERFFNERFRAWLSELEISLMAIDEAHCISQWGHNFRPDYLKLGELVQQFSVRRVLALTATATRDVVQDIRHVFLIDEKDVVRTRFFRPNLQLYSTGVSESGRKAYLLEQLKSRPQGPTLVYVTTQRTAEEIAEYLQENELEAYAYHAGLPAEKREEIQQTFLASQQAIVVATIAFGMGIDKPDIRYVYHFNLSKSMEAYAQEIGRAGRDGKDAICESLVVPEDRVVIDNFTYGDTPDEASIAKFVEILAGQPDPFYISHYRLSSETDIRILVVRTLLTYLELDGFLVAKSPRYDSYQFRPLVTSAQILKHFTGERRQFVSDILASATKRRTWYEIPLPIIARRLNEPRERIVKALDYLEEKHWIELRVADLVHGFQKGKPIVDREAIIQSLADRMQARESGEIHRMDQVLELLAANQCMAWRLSDHFGENLDAACGRCTACRTGPVEVVRNLTRRSIGRSALRALESLRSNHPEQLATSRQQARFLCGLSTPGLTRTRLNREPSFGVCADLPFRDVLESLLEARR